MKRGTRLKPEDAPATPRDRVCIALASHAVSMATEREVVATIFSDWMLANDFAIASTLDLFDVAIQLVTGQMVKSKEALFRHYARTSMKYLDSWHKHKVISDDDWGKAMNVLQGACDVMTVSETAGR